MTTFTIEQHKSEIDEQIQSADAQHAALKADVPAKLQDKLRVRANLLGWHGQETGHSKLKSY